MVIFNISLVIFFWIETKLLFFNPKGNLPLFRHVLKIMFRALQIASPYNFNIRILFMSWPGAFESWLLIIWIISVSEEWQEFKVFSVINFTSDGNILLFAMRAHLLAKKELKVSIISLKFLTYLLLWKIRSMHRTFFLFRINFNSDQ